MLEWLRTDPLGFFSFMIYRAPAVLIALTLHELAHGYVAYRCGDPTAKLMGRLTLNPLKHLDLVGTIMMFTVGMGWAKPVPVNPYRYRNGVRDDFFVSIAGVAVNFILFALSTLLTVLIVPSLITDAYAAFYGYDFFLSFKENGFGFLLTENSDMLQYVVKSPLLLHVTRFLFQFSLCNLGACMFNLLPFPPLDGFHVFNDILLKGRIRLSREAFRYSMIALLVLMNVTDVFSNLLSGAINGIQSGVLTLYLNLFTLM